jgi:catechol 2,3-dioxygenase-like lactoylglutathione lyase family enzyme
MYRSFVFVCVLLAAGTGLAQVGKPTRPAITGISHVTLFADDFSRSQRFYASTLGWEQIPAGTPRSGVHFYANHLQYIELLSPPGKALEDRLAGVAFSTKDAEAMRKYLAANGLEVPLAVKVESNGDRCFAMRDPKETRSSLRSLARMHQKGKLRYQPV